MRSVNILVVVLLLGVAYFNGAEARSEDDLRFVGIRAVFTKVLVTNVTQTVFKTCSRARGTNFELPGTGATGCTTCNQATGVAGSTCDETAACGFAVVPARPVPIACICEQGSPAAGDTAIVDPDVAGAVCTPGALCPVASLEPAADSAAPVVGCKCPVGGAGSPPIEFDSSTTACATALAGLPGNSPGISSTFICFARPPSSCPGGCDGPATDEYPAGTCSTAADTQCSWAIVPSAPKIDCACSAAGVAATAATDATCPAGTLCTEPTATTCQCDSAAAPTPSGGCPAEVAGAPNTCVRIPPTGCGTCTATGTAAGTGSGTSCAAWTNCVRGSDVAPCTGKRKRRNVPVNLPKDSQFDNTELGSTIDRTISNSGAVSSDKQQKFVFTIWETTTERPSVTVTSLNSATTVSLSYACEPSLEFDSTAPAC